MSNFFDDLAKKRARAKPLTPHEVADDDLAGLLQRMIANEIAAQLQGLPKPAGAGTPLSARADAMFRRMHKALDSVPEPAPSVIPKPPPSEVPGDFGVTITHRDEFGRAAKVKFEGSRGTHLAVIDDRDDLGRIRHATFSKVAA
ncbi:MAG: hypothetical protein HYZ18_04250 [Pseudogulbenkiania sp.]|nr:hypothetical protein [Pseudogulbenkiania sp.]